MRLSDDVLRGLLEAVPDAILAVDDDGRIVYANQRVQDLFGWRADELVGQAIEVLVPPSAMDRHVAHRASYLNDPVARPMGLGLQLRARRHDGSEFPAEISLSAIATEDHRSVVLAAVRDVTERLEFERARQERALAAQREQSHRLESIGQLAGGVAHDFNNLLGVILNYATLAERAVEDPQVAEDIRQIRDAADRAADLTRQLLSFARRDVARPERLDLDELVRQFSQMLTRTLGEHIALVVDGPESPASVHADRNQLEQVLLNLCLNARDAMPDGGTLRLTIGVGEQPAGTVPGLIGGRYATLRVIDEGRGMATEVADRAFEPFFTTKPAGEGTGLGLASVYGIVQQSGGSVRIFSELGVGTTVEVLLPASDDPAAFEEGVVAPTPKLGRIVVVEDEEWLRTVVCRMLEGAGYEVLPAEDGRDALKVFAELDQPVDLVLSDVVMPGVSGPELVTELRARGVRVPVLFMSGYAPQDLDLADAPLLLKPFTEDQLFTEIRRAIDG